MDIKPIRSGADYRVSLKEILNHKRSLTLKMIWKLNQELGIPAESLIKPPRLILFRPGAVA